MLVFADGRIVGTIGGGCYENDAFWKAREAIATPQAAARPLRALATTSRRRPGSSAAARWTSTSSRSSRRPSSTSSAPATSAFTSRGSRTKSASASTSSTIARSSRTASAFPTPRKSSSTTFPPGSQRAALPPHAYVVIVTRGHTNDLDALRALAPRELRYLGLIGSRAKVARIYDALVAEGMPADVLDARPRADRPRHRRRHAAGNRRQHPRRADRREARQDRRGRDAAELSMQWNNLEGREGRTARPHVLIRNAARSSR